MPDPMVTLKLVVCLAAGYAQALVIRQPLNVYARQGGGLCSGTNVVPQLYFLGAQKAATTTISKSFEYAGGLMAIKAQCMHCSVEVAFDQSNENESFREDLCHEAGGLWHPLKQYSDEHACTSEGFQWVKNHVTKERNVFCDNDDWAEQICSAGTHGPGGRCNCFGAPGWNRTWSAQWCADGACNARLEGDARCAAHPEATKHFLEDGSWCYKGQLTTQCATTPEAALEDSSFLEKLSGGFPKCPPLEAPPVLAADFSTYLARNNVMERIIRAYGSAATHLTFALSLRNPISRLESAFVQIKEESGNWGRQFLSLKNQDSDVLANFSAFAMTVMSVINQTSFSSDIGTEIEQHIQQMVSNSLYGEHLQRILNNIDASQVIVAPMMDIVSGGEKATKFMQTIQTLTGTNVEARESMSGDFARAFESGQPLNSHASQETGQEDRLELRSISVQQLQDIMDRDTDLLAILLATHDKIKLPTFIGNRTSAADLRTWLTANW